MGVWQGVASRLWPELGPLLLVSTSEQKQGKLELSHACLQAKNRCRSSQRFPSSLDMAATNLSANLSISME